MKPIIYQVSAWPELSRGRIWRGRAHCLQVRDRLGIAAGGSLAVPVTSGEESIQVMPDGDLQNVRGGP
jgi:hypothetical protein